MKWLQQNFKSESYGKLNWYEPGVGWLAPESEQIEYGQKYFDEFKAKADTPLGRNIMRARVEFVARHYHGLLCDIGIGSGAFIETRRTMTCGWDVNPIALAWLKSRNLLMDPSEAYCPAISMWDVLEHIPNFYGLLNNVLHWIFLSIPIFRDQNHALASKHFKPGEHCWYFTDNGLRLVMEHFGFQCVERSSFESKLGRDEIGSFAFQRVAK